MKSLTHIDIQGLLGQFNHKVKFPEESEFVILHGPNGVGKTKLLELIDATFAGDLIGVMQVPFVYASFGFSDGSMLQLSRREQLTLPTDDAISEGDITVTFILSVVENLNDYHWESPPSGVLLDRLIGSESPGTMDLYTYERTRSISSKDMRLDSPIIRELTSSRSPRDRRLISRVSGLPKQLVEFLSSIDVHLIETQRLLNRVVSRSRPTSPFDTEPARSTVLRYSEDITRRISSALAENSRRSQELDRKFPRRLMSNEPLPAEATEDAIRERYEKQGELRKRLSDISLLDTFPDMPLPSRQLEDWQKRVLWTYLDDTDQKLATFSSLLDRVVLLREIVNSRFLNKELNIDRERGFYFETQSGRRLDASQLSSGEQHELVLMYGLLFNASPDSLVLIDEPEISLHVTWQQQFLSDIKRIANLNALRFIVATHSPQVVHTWWDRAVALGPEEL